jgi:DNA-directed RNA polymerase specialized sigma24 family protein
MASAVRRVPPAVATEPMPDTATPSGRLAHAGETVRAVLRRKSGMSLRDDDPRLANLEALELHHDVVARLWEREVDAGADAPANAAAFAATVAHNAWSDHLRRKYPRRTSLKNRLRYFLSHQPKYRVWDSAEGDSVAGLHAWHVTGRAPADPARLRAWTGADGQRAASLARASVPRKPMEACGADDWDRLLGALFEQAQAPLVLDDLVRVVALLLDLQEDRVESLSGSDEDNDFDPADTETPGPERRAEIRAMLRQLWGAVRALRPDYRLAYLLNIPGAGKTRGDIEVFALHGIASIEEIAAAIGLDAAQYQRLFAQLPLNDADQAVAAACSDELERFALLWRQLPLPDAVIGTLLGLEQQQVINRRMLALRELARLLAQPIRPASPRT